MWRKLSRKDYTYTSKTQGAALSFNFFPPDMGIWGMEANIRIFLGTFSFDVDSGCHLEERFTFKIYGMKNLMRRKI